MGEPFTGIWLTASSISWIPLTRLCSYNTGALNRKTNKQKTGHKRTWTPRLKKGCHAKSSHVGSWVKPILQNSEVWDDLVLIVRLSWEERCTGGRQRLLKRTLSPIKKTNGPSLSTQSLLEQHTANFYPPAPHFSAPFYARLRVYLEKWLLVVFTLGEGWNVTCLHELSPNTSSSSSQNISVTISGSEVQSLFRSRGGSFMASAEVNAANPNIKCRGFVTTEVLKSVLEINLPAN